MSADGKRLTEFKRSNRVWVELKDMAPHVIDALIATEDHRFREHFGLDWRRTASSALHTLGGDRQGGSTLTQQLARTLYPEEIGRAPTLTRKLKEAITALKIEAIYSKDEILETYLNTVPFLYNAYGIEMAARTYFDRSADRLDLLQGATLVGMLKGNSYYNPVLNPERALQRRNTVLAQMVKRGKLSPAEMEQRLACISGSIEMAAVKDADMVIEAVFEDLAVKQAVFRQVDAHARAGAVLATNTSYLDIDDIAAVTSRPQDLLGLHFFSPANVMKLLEVVRGAHSAPDVLATGMELGRRLKKLPVLCGNAFGFIGNRIYNAYRRQCEFMLEDGAWPEEVDQALTGIGFAMGPFAVADLSGLDIAWRMRKAQAETRDPRERYVAILDRLCEQGRLGRKTGAGYYAYPDGKQQRSTDSTVRAIIEQASAERGITRQPLSPEQIRRRALLAMVNEAALLLAEGVAVRASDIDVVLVQGYGFPRWEGGPVFWAQQQDRAELEQAIDGLAAIVGHGFVRGDLARLLG